MKTMQFKTWAAAIAVGAGLLFATGVKAQAVLDFSALDSLGTVVTANVGRATGAVYVGDFVGDGPLWDTVKFVPSGDFLTSTEAGRMRNITLSTGSCGFSTHEVQYNHNGSDVVLNLVSTAATKVEIYAYAANANSYIFTGVGDGNGKFFQHPENGLNSQLDRWISGTQVGRRRDIMIDTAFNAARTVATYTFKNSRDTLTSVPVVMKVEILTPDRTFTANNLTLSGSNVCLKITLTGFYIPQGGQLVWRSPGAGNLRYQKIQVSADATLGGEEEAPVVLPESIEITNIPASPLPWVEYTLGATVLPNDATDKSVEWSIEAGSAVITNGKIKASAAGSVTVRAASVAAPLVFADSVIEFIAPTPATSVEITNIPAEAILGLSYTLGYTVLPSDATYKTATWSINNTGTTADGASVSAAGLVTATGAGNVVVRITVDSTPSVFADSTLTFFARLVSSVSITNAPAGAMAIGATRQLGATVLPSDATDKAITWSLVTAGNALSITPTGLVTAIADGVDTVRATAVGGAHADLAITVSSAVVVLPKRETLVIYENFVNWPAVHGDSLPDARFAGWRARRETNAVGLGNTAHEQTPQPSSGTSPYLIDSILKYKPAVSSAVTVNNVTKSYSYNSVPLLNDYTVGGQASVGFNLINAAVFPDFYNALCYDTVMAPGGYWGIPVGQAGWEKSYVIPANNNFNCSNPDEKGFIAFANGILPATIGAGVPTLTIPAEANGYLTDVSKVEIDFSGTRLAQIGVLAVVAEHLDAGGVVTKSDTFTYSSINYTTRKAVVPVNGERVRLYLKAVGGGNPSFWDYQHANTTGVGTFIEAMEPYTFNRNAIVSNATATGNLGNIGMNIYALKVYALLEDAGGYSLTLENGATASKSSGIAHGETVTVESSSSTFVGWRISGRPDLSERANPLTLTVTENLTIRALLAGETALVAVIDEDFTDAAIWEQKAVISPADTVGGVQTGFLHFTNQVGGAANLDTYGLVDSLVVSVPLRYGFTTPAGEDRVNVTLRYCNVAPNSTIRLYNAPGAEQWRGLIGFGALDNNTKGYFEIDTLEGIQKAVVELSSYDIAPANQAQAAVAVFKNDTLIRNIANLRHFDARKAEVELDGSPAKLTIGQANNSTHEFLVTLDTFVTIQTWNRLIPDVFGTRVKKAQVNNVLAGTNARYCAMHSLKLYAEVVLEGISDDATLRELSIASRTATGDEVLNFTEAFDPATFTYTVDEDRLVDSVVVISAVANHSMATIEAGSTGAKTLAPGLNTLTIKVTAENGDELVYTINVTRVVLNTDAALSSLTVNGTSVSNFAPNTVTYNMNIQVSTADVVGTPRNANATVRSGNGPHDLNLGQNQIQVVVVAEDTTVTRTYTINILRTEPATAVESDEYTVSLYPNPVTGSTLTVEGAALAEGDAIEVYSLSGTLMVTYNATGEATTIDVSQLPNGTYLLKAGKYVAKFIKQ